MKKEVREKISDFKRREANLLFVIMKNAEQAAANKLFLAKLRRDKTQWLREIGGYSQSMPMETVAKLDELVAKAADSISIAALRNAQLQAYLDDAIKNGSDRGRYHEVMVENYGQLEALSEMAAADNVKALERFNRKINGKSFLSVLACKFRKSKAQESESVKSENAIQK